MRLVDRLSQLAPRLEMPALWLFSRLLVFFMVQRGGSDIPLYEQFANRLAAGELPYCDFSLDHPPLVLLVAALPRLLGAVLDYATAFRGLMLLCDLSIFRLLTNAVRDSSHRRSVQGLYIWLGAIAFPVLYERVDLVLALLLTVLLWCGLTKRSGWGYVTLSLCTLTNFGTVFLVPVWVVYDLRGGDRRPAFTRGLLFVTAYAAVIAAGAALLGSGFTDFIRYHWQSGVQLESLAASLMIIAHPFGLDLAVDGRSGIFILTGQAPVVVGGFVLIAGLLTWLIVLWKAWRSSPFDRTGLFAGLLVSLLAFQLSSPVFLPQYVLWLLPLAALGLAYVPQRRVWTLLWLAVAAYTTTVFPLNYVSLIRLQFWGSAAVVLRNLTLVVLAGWSAWWWMTNHTRSDSEVGAG